MSAQIIDFDPKFTADQKEATPVPKAQGTNQGGMTAQGGSAMLAIIALLELQQAMLQAMKEWSEFTALSYKNQMVFAEAAGESIKQAAEDAGYSQIIGGLITIGSAVVGMAFNFMKTSKMKELISQQEDTQKELQPLENNLNTLDNLKGSDEEAIVGDNSERTITEQEAREKLTQLKNTKEDFTEEYTTKDGKKARRFKQEHIKELEKAKTLNEFSSVRESLDLKRANIQRKLDTLVTQSSNISQRISNIGNAVTQLGSSLNGISQGTGQILKGQQEMQLQIQQAESQQNASIASQDAQAREQANQAANNVEQIINQLKKSEMQA